jgi:hypothetical protein
MFARRWSQMEVELRTMAMIHNALMLLLSL